MVAQIALPHRFQARDYQTGFWKAMNAGCKRAILLWHRRAGKDKTSLNFTIKEMAKRVGSYYYYFPTMSLGRKIVWDGVDKDGFRFLDHFPRDFIAGQPNSAEMKIKTVNGSVFQIVGTDRLDVVGPNPVGCVYSEFALQNPRGWDYTRPILAENGGWAVFPFTPRGKNHGYRLTRMAEASPKEWYVSRLTVDDTHAITQDAIDVERRSGMTEQLIQQEFYVSFEGGVQGSFYADIVSHLYNQGRITNDLTYNPSLPVHSVCDPGYHWPWVLFQIRGNEPVIIDSWQDLGMGIEDHVTKLLDLGHDRGYHWGQHFAPIDAERNNAYKTVAGKTLVDHAREFGIVWTILNPEYRVMDGIQRARKMLFTTWIIQGANQTLIDALEDYHAARSSKSSESDPMFIDRPDDTWSVHLADTVRYLSMAIPMIDTVGSNERILELIARHG